MWHFFQPPIPLLYQPQKKSCLTKDSVTDVEPPHSGSKVMIMMRMLKAIKFYILLFFSQKNRL